MVRILDYPDLMEAALFRNTLPAHFAHPDSRMSAAQCRRVLAAFAITAATRLQWSGVPVAATAWAVSRIGVALFLLATAEHLGHAGLLSRLIGH